MPRNLDWHRLLGKLRTTHTRCRSPASSAPYCLQCHAIPATGASSTSSRSFSHKQTPFGGADFTCRASERQTATRSLSRTFTLLTLTRTTPYCLGTRIWHQRRSTASSPRQSRARTLDAIIWWSIACYSSVLSRTKPCTRMSRTTLSRFWPAFATFLRRRRSLSPKSSNFCQIDSIVVRLLILRYETVFGNLSFLMS